MGARRRLSDGAPGPGFADRSEYERFDEELLPLAVQAAETTAAAFISSAQRVYEVHPWTVSRWLWSAHSRGLIEALDEHYVGFRARPDATVRAMKAARD